MNNVLASVADSLAAALRHQGEVFLSRESYTVELSSDRWRLDFAMDMF